MDGAPETLNCRARRALRADGRHVAPGDLVRLPIGTALAGASCGQVEIVGPEAAMVGTRPAATWTPPRVGTAGPAPSEWMLGPGDRGSLPAAPRAAAARGYRATRPTVTALQLFARWFGGGS